MCTRLKLAGSRAALVSSWLGTLVVKAANGSDQWLAAHGQPSLRDDARESICIAWFRASHPDGAAVHSTQGNPTGATGPHAMAARSLLEATRPIDEGDDGFTSGCPANTAGFQRTRHGIKHCAAPRSRLAIRPLAAKRSPASISISIASRVDAAGSRKRRGGLPSMGQRTLGTVAINGSRPTGNHHSATMPASPFASRGSERPIQIARLSTPPKEILPGQQGHTQRGPAAARAHAAD